MIYLPTNIAKTQDVPLDGSIFFGNIHKSGPILLAGRNIPIQLS